jgi:hypothetical protein
MPTKAELLEENTRLIKSTIKGWAIRIQYMIDNYINSDEAGFGHVNQLQSLVSEMFSFSGE